MCVYNIIVCARHKTTDRLTYYNDRLCPGRNDDNCYYYRSSTARRWPQHHDLFFLFFFFRSLQPLQSSTFFPPKIRRENAAAAPLQLGHIMCIVVIWARKFARLHTSRYLLDCSYKFRFTSTSLTNFNTKFRFVRLEVFVIRVFITYNKIFFLWNTSTGTSILITKRTYFKMRLQILNFVAILQKTRCHRWRIRIIFVPTMSSNKNP